MKKGRRTTIGLIAAVVLALCASAAVWAAADDEPIERLTLKIESKIQVGAEHYDGDIVVTTDDDGYIVRYTEFLNEGDVWGIADTPRVLLHLRRESGYYFNVPQSRVRIRGAELESAGWDEDLLEYLIIVTLPSLREQVGEIAEAGWTDLVSAVWDETYNTVYYELQLYRGDKKEGPVHHVKSGTYNFGTIIQAEGDYHYRVRAVNVRNEHVKSAWVESPVLTVDQELLARIREQYGDIVVGTPAPGDTNPIYADMYGWIYHGDKWWYRNPDGGFTVNDWQLIDGLWYYFDSQGYMVTGWIQWNDKCYYCDPETGAMMVNRIVPDGRGRRVDSSGAWIQ